MFTPQALLKLFFKKLPFILILGFCATLISFLFFKNQATNFEARTFISIGNPVEVNRYTEINADFSETLIGIIKGGEFEKLVTNLLKIPRDCQEIEENEKSSTIISNSCEIKNQNNFTFSCNASTYEKGNLYLYCNVDNLGNAVSLSEELENALSIIVQDYNQKVGTKYALGYSVSSVEKVIPSNKKLYLSAFLIGTILGYLVILIITSSKRKIWDKSQIEAILEHEVSKTNLKILNKINKKQNLVFLGKKEIGFENSLELLENLEKFDNQKNYLILKIDETSFDDINFIKQFICTETKIFCIEKTKYLSQLKKI